MEKYQKGKIYKLTNEETNDVYYGSTTKTLKQRFSSHKCDYKRYLEEKEHYYSSFEIIKYSSAVIELVEEFPCDTKKELHERERYYIENNECVNRDLPGRTQKEYKEDNKKKIRQKMKEYRNKNKKKIAEKGKEYRANNKEKLREYQDKNKEKIRERRKEKLQCECGREIARGNISTHKKTNFHITTLLNININN